MDELYVLIIVCVISAILLAVSFWLNSKVPTLIWNESIKPYDGAIFNFGTSNLIGFTMIRGVRVHPIGAYSGYEFFVFLNMPIIPVGCYLYTDLGTERVSYKQERTTYKIYGEIRWNIWEVLSIYLGRYSVIALFISVLGIICNIFF